MTATKTLIEKLGWKPGHGVRIVTPVPPGVLLPVPEGAGDGADLVIGFVAWSKDVAAVAADALALYRDGARLWLVYPKKGSAVATDMTRDKGWGGLPADLLPVAQVAVDADWSALRFRRRHEIAKLTRRSEAAHGAA